MPELYKKLSKTIKETVSKLESYSIVIDEWADEGNSHVLLGVTLHHVDDDLEPKHIVLSAEPIKPPAESGKPSTEGQKTSKNISRVLNEVFTEFDIDKKKVTYLLRDGASVVVKVGKINGFDSEHCLAHGIQLVRVFV